MPFPPPRYAREITRSVTVSTVIFRYTTCLISSERGDTFQESFSLTAGIMLQVTKHFLITYSRHTHRTSMWKDKTPPGLGVAICIILMFYCETVSAVLPVCTVPTVIYKM